MNEMYCRIYQNVLRLSSYFIAWRKPEVLEGPGCIQQVPGIIKNQGVNKVLIVTGKNVSALGLLDPLLSSLKEEAIDFFVFGRTVPNPTIENIEEALQIYKVNGCNGIIAFGGGSPIDCAKGVACRAARPDRTIAQMKGVLKVNRKLPPLIAIPTTAGSGSETTVAAVISNPDTHEKYAVNDPSLIPAYAVLDPLVTVGLPPHITAQTGMDALTHAVEAYIGRSNTKETKKMALEAVRLIFDNLFIAYSQGDNLEARGNMQKASFCAGVAFTRAYVGYVHGIAHALGGFYSLPHGLANAVILPYILEAYGKPAYRKLAELADAVGITVPTDTRCQKAGKFIEAIRQMNRDMAIPNKIQGILVKDIPLMAERACKECNPLYPVPRIMDIEELAGIFVQIKSVDWLF